VILGSIDRFLRNGLRRYQRATWPIARRAPRFLQHTVFGRNCLLYDQDCRWCSFKERIERRWFKLMISKAETKMVYELIDRLRRSVKVRQLRPPDITDTPDTREGAKSRGAPPR
jgi:hypothetical protein